MAFFLRIYVCVNVCVCVIERRKQRGVDGEEMEKTRDSEFAYSKSYTYKLELSRHPTHDASSSALKKKSVFFLLSQSGVNVCKPMCAQSSQAPCAHPDRQEKRQLRSTAHIKKSSFRPKDRVAWHIARTSSDHNVRNTRRVTFNAAEVMGARQSTAVSFFFFFLFPATDLLPI